MVKKLTAACVVAIALVAVAVPASALAPLAPKTARLSAQGTSRGTATLGYDGTKWYGSVRTRAGALPPGTYAYGVELLKKVGGGSGDILCSFTITTPGQTGGCHGTSKYLTKGFWRAVNLATVYDLGTDEPVLTGTFH